MGRGILRLGAADNPPAHLLFGTDALRLVRDKLSVQQSTK
ncbi:hypothetical protein CFter6_2705 [Collimonas fungivorans]|uniref:Uncharacterized protein n=1 Tax=Collimonas fungivorans TaxID=158899 RepID=A0A127PCC0_9BURK|nr:hypothetical protein CFter6_2705 [Collimonas fungivorans]